MAITNFEDDWAMQRYKINNECNIKYNFLVC